MTRQSEHTHTQNGRRVEVAWTDSTDVYARVTNHQETHLEQQDAPDDAVAMVSIGKHRVERTHSMGRDRERRWIELYDGAYLTADQAVETALLLLESAAQWRAEQVEFEGPVVGAVAPDDERRWDLHVAACSIEDMTFWIQKTEEGYVATEVETGGTSLPAPSAREAMENYWEQRF